MKANLIGALVLSLAAHNLFATDFWQSLDGPSDNAVWGFAFQSTSGTLVASFPSEFEPDGPIRGSSVFHSTDQGNTWMALTNWPVARRASTLYASGSGSIFAGSQVNGVYRSSDGGINWSPTTNGLAGAQVACLGGNSVGDVFAGTTGSGIFRSTNNGADWLAVNAGLGSFDVKSIATDSDGRLFIGTPVGIFKSTNDGALWTSANSGLTTFVITELVAGPDDDIFAGTTNGIFRSINHGDSWIPLPGLSNEDVRSFCVNPTGDWFVGTAGGLFVSTNHGISWADADLGLTNISVGRLTCDNSGNIFAGTAVGVYRSQDGGNTWQRSANGMAIGAMFSMAFDSKGQFFAGTISAGLHRSRDLGQTWERVLLPGLRSSVHIFSLGVSPSDTIFAGTYILSPFSPSTHLFRSQDGGDTWQTGNSPVLRIHVAGGFAFGATGEVFATAGFNTSAGAGVIRSDDNGANWYSTGLSNVVTYSVRRNSEGYLFAGTECCGVYRSLDNGTNWASVGPIAGNILSIAINASNHVFAASSTGIAKGIYRSLDNGASWVNTLTNVAADSLIITREQAIYCGAEEGVFVSTNNGASWSLINSGLPSSMPINCVQIGPDGHLYAGSGGRGIYRSVLPVDPVSTLSLTLDNGSPMLQLRGMANRTYSIVTSSNLLDWISAGSLTTGVDGVSVPVNIGAGVGQVYYRSVWP